MKAVFVAALALSVSTEAMLARAYAQSPPTRVDRSIALNQVIKKVDPLLPDEVVAANPGALIAADVVIRMDGTVESVTILVGPDALQDPAIAAVKQWTFRPFIIAGRPARVVTLMDVITLPAPARDAERRAFSRYTAARVACERSLSTKAPDADRVCGDLVRASDALPARSVLKRVHAGSPWA